MVVTFSGGSSQWKNVVLSVVFVVGLVAVAAVGVLTGRHFLHFKAPDFNDPAAVARRVLTSVPLIDGHNDLPWQLQQRFNNSIEHFDFDNDVRDLWKDSSTDIPRLKTGLLGAQFWVAYVSCRLQHKTVIRQTLEQLDVIKRLISKYPDTFKPVTTAKGIIDAFTEGKIGSLIGVEGGHSIDSSLGVLRMYYDLGVRYMTLTHTCDPPWAGNSNLDRNNSTHFRGLSHFGKDVVAEMNRLGMMVDLAHVSVDTMRDALATSDAPIIFSHSSAWSLCNNYRNVPDDILKITANKGGLIMINFHGGFINCSPRNQTNVTLSQVADHIEYIRNLTGPDHVGIGSDFDGGIIVPQGLEDVSKYPDLFTEMARRGWSERDLKKLAGENLLRVFTKVEHIRDAKSQHERPIEVLLPESQRPQIKCTIG